MADRTSEHDSWMNLWGLAGSGHPSAPAGGTVAPHGAGHPSAPVPGTGAQRPSPARQAWNGIVQAQADQTAATEVHAQQAGSWTGRAMHTVNGWGASAYNAMPTVVQRGLSQAESIREGAAEGVGTAWNWAGAHITGTAKAADGVIRKAGTAADGLATHAIASGTDAVRRHVGDGAATAFQAGAGSLQRTARTGAQFQYGVTTGILQEGGSMVSGIGTLAGGAYRLTVDGRAREQAAAGLARNLVRLDEDPTGVALGAGKGVYHAGANWVQGAQDAAGRGGLSEYLGNSTGHVLGFAATIVAPEALLGKAGEAASVAGRTADAVTAGGRTGEAVTAGSRTGKAVTTGGKVDDALSAARSTAAAVEGAPLTEAAAGSVKHVNPTGNGLNCTDCALSVDQQLRTGARTVAPPRAAARPFSELNRMYETTFSGWVSRADIEAELLKRGDGATAIIYGMTADARQGHVWNAVVQRGIINYIDGQVGGAGLRNFSHFKRYRFGLTGGGK